MTINQLSAQSVKVQLTADELRMFLPEKEQDTDSPQMLRLISMLLMKAEHYSAIPFSELPVTVELLGAPDGGLVAYFTAQLPQDTAKRGRAKNARKLAAEFSDTGDLRACCVRLCMYNEALSASVLYRYHGCYILILRLKHGKSELPRHLMLEYGRPYRLTGITSARLEEYGRLICGEDAVEAVAGGAVLSDQHE